VNCEGQPSFDLKYLSFHLSPVYGADVNLRLLNRNPDSTPFTSRIPTKTLSILAVSGAIATYILIIYGSHVRVTDSGMGCPDWPLCKGSIGPFQGFHAFMEQTHRYLAGIVSVLVIATWFLASRMRNRISAIKPALFTVGIVLVQIILGAITVFDSNGAPTVAAHLLAGLALLAGATVTAVASFFDKGEATNPRLGSLGWSAIGAATLLYFSGSLIVNAEAEKACARFLFCPPTQPLHLVVLHLLHRSVAFFAIIILIAFAFHAWTQWSIITGARPLALLLVGFLVATGALGIFSALLKAPPDLQDLHLAGAAAVLVASVALATVGWLAGADSRM
jgi:heme A synthase